MPKIYKIKVELTIIVGREEYNMVTGGDSETDLHGLSKELDIIGDYLGLAYVTKEVL